MATLVAKTVDPNGTGDYPSLSAAEYANFGATGADLVSNDEYVVCTCICTGGTADTTAATISGQTTDATHTITVTVDVSYRHAGKYATGNVYRLELTGQVTLAKDVTLSGVIIKRTATADSQFLLSTGTNQGNVTVDSCVLYFISSGTYKNLLYGFSRPPAGESVYFKNCVSYGDSTTPFGNSGFIMSASSAGTTYYYGCTSSKVRYGFYYSSGGTAVAKNCLAYNTDGFYGTFDAASTNNASYNSDAPATNAVNLAGHAGTEIFRDYANDNFRIKNSAPHIRSAGTDLRTDPTLPVTVDIEGETRHAVPDIGADEYYPYPGEGGGGATIWLGKRYNPLTGKVQTACYWRRG